MNFHNEFILYILNINMVVTVTAFHTYRPDVSGSIDAAGVEHFSVQVYCRGQKAPGRRRYGTTVTIYEGKTMNSFPETWYLHKIFTV